MIIITSAAFVNDDLRAEFGLIPPCFLPLGNKRLYRHQIDILKKAFPNENIVISLPDEYSLGECDKLYLKKNNIIIIKTPYNMNQGESLFKIINELRITTEEKLIINYGDSLFSSISHEGEDYFYVSRNIGYYNRAPVSIDNAKFKIGQNKPAVDNGELVISGFFCISNINLFLQKINCFEFNFLNAIESYYSCMPTNIIESKDWFDFGHLNSFFSSRTSITTEREFNKLLINCDYVTKKSKKKQKMLGEANWFKSLPNELSLYTPRIFDVKEDEQYVEYTIEYLYNLPLSDMAVFCELPLSSWLKVFSSCSMFLCRSKLFSNKNINENDLKKYDDLYLPKTLRRLSDFEKTTNVDLNKEIIFNGNKYPSILELAKITSKYINPTRIEDVNISHGDYCFSNILYDFRTQRIKLIDPRGIDFNNELSIWGDMRYDLAKLNHSVSGRYDLIIAEQYYLLFDYKNNIIDFELYDHNYNAIIESYNIIFSDYRSFGYSSLEINCITIHLFLSMLPLHSDSKFRQGAFIANAYRLFSDLNLEVL